MLSLRSDSDAIRHTKRIACQSMRYINILSRHRQTPYNVISLIYLETSMVCVRCGNQTNRTKAAKYCNPCKVIMPKIQNWARNQLVSAALAGKVDYPYKHPCKYCGNQASIWEHRDYSAPTVVDYVCASCNCKAGPAMFNPPDTIDTRPTSSGRARM